MVASQFYVLGNSRVLVSEHKNIKLCIAGEDVFHSVSCCMEGQMDVSDLVIVCGQRNFVCQTIRYSFLKHGYVVTAGVQGVQIFTEVCFPLGTVSICIDAGT